ncbi:hypothetical protein AB0D34_18195 [Streptomyces sp. NPDC048420]|uniref:hypothetical protein n=1 Tax=Streptomyces sp. NPDC048420 TaxID=3155755 RepID=UPI003444440A
MSAVRRLGSPVGRLRRMADRFRAVTGVRSAQSSAATVAAETAPLGDVSRTSLGTTDSAPSPVMSSRL